MAAPGRLLQQQSRLGSHIARRMVRGVVSAPTANSTEAVAPPTSAQVTKEVKDLQGPIPWPIVGNFFAYVKKENKGKLHELQARQHRQYGKMFREKLGPQTNVHVADPDLIEQVMRNQGRYPVRSSFNSWKNYRHVSGESTGLLTSEGEEWLQVRSVLSKRMLKPKSVEDFSDIMNNIVTDMIGRIRYIRDTEGDERLVREVPNELYKWAMESIGTVLFETRMGCLDSEMPPKVQEFIDAINRMMSSSLQIIIGDELHAKLNTKYWRVHKEAWDKLFEIAKSYIDERLETIQGTIKTEERSGSVQEGPTEFLTYLLSSKAITMPQIYANMTELMLSGIDTTSNTLCFTLQLLANHPEVQEKLHKEVTEVLDGRIPDAKDLKDLHYLKCVVKETLRLYPVVTMNVRILQDDLVLNGYKIPKHTMMVLNHYAACRDESVFEKATEFIPERWDREENHKIHAFAALPFGYGTRSCIGRRVAELELYLALSRITQNFNLKPFENFKFEPQLRTLLTPGEGIPVRFLER